MSSSEDENISLLEEDHVPVRLSTLSPLLEAGPVIEQVPLELQRLLLLPLLGVREQHQILVDQTGLSAIRRQTKRKHKKALFGLAVCSGGSNCS